MIAFVNKLLVSKTVQAWINQNTVARCLGRLSDTKKIPRPILQRIIHAFVENFKIPLDEYDIDLEHVECFNDFFTRKIRLDLRPLGSGVVSPVDGTITQCGAMREQRLLQVKGQAFQLSDLVKDTPKFSEGHYCIIYLSPANYHRFHAPFNLSVESITYIPGDLLATNAQSLKEEEQVYCRNERIILKGESEFGVFYLVAVGATAVGRIRLSFNSITTNKKFQQPCELLVSPPKRVLKGEELGLFELGSTVILLVERTNLQLCAFGESHAIKLGETLWT